MVESVTIITPLKGQEVEVGLVAERHKMALIGGRPLYTPIYDERAVEFIAGLVRERIAMDWDCIMLYTGERGVGKSTLAMEIGLAYDPSLSVESIVFDTDEFSKQFQTNAPGKQIIFDEAVWGLFSDQWMHRAQIYIVKVLDVGRARRQVSSFIVPDRRHLIRKIREDMPHLWFHVMALRGERGFCEVRIADRNNPFYGTFWKPLLAFVYSPYAGPLWEGYEKKKAAFLTRATDKKVSLSREDNKDQIILNLRREGYSTRQTAKVLDLDQSTIVRRLQQFDART
jgi:hypothetical protein